MRILILFNLILLFFLPEKLPKEITGYTAVKISSDAAFPLNDKIKKIQAVEYRTSSAEPADKFTTTLVRYTSKETALGALVLLRRERGYNTDWKTISGDHLRKAFVTPDLTYSLGWNKNNLIIIQSEISRDRDEWEKLWENISAKWKRGTAEPQGFLLGWREESSPWEIDYHSGNSFFSLPWRTPDGVNYRLSFRSFSSQNSAEKYFMSLLSKKEVELAVFDASSGPYQVIIDHSTVIMTVRDTLYSIESLNEEPVSAEAVRTELGKIREALGE